MFFRKSPDFKPKQPQHEVETYVLDERRTSRYTFTSTKSLVRYFSAWLPKEEIEAIIENAKTDFVQRRGCSEEETHLQFLKKCEYSLVRLLRSGAAA